jgi:hypothetical protein
MPGVPISFAYCKECIHAGAHPWWAVVANTAQLGGLHLAADWWVALVERTCEHLGKTRAEFNAAVAVEIEAQREMLERQPEQRKETT